MPKKSHCSFGIPSEILPAYVNRLEVFTVGKKGAITNTQRDGTKTIYQMSLLGKNSIPYQKDCISKFRLIMQL